MPANRAPKRHAPTPTFRELALPTAKLGAAAVTVVALAMLAGAAIGLPVPLLSDDAAPATAPGAGQAVDAGTPAALTKGPFQPVLGPLDYGQKDARFGARRPGHIHEGQDLFARKGTPLVAVRDSIVVDWGTTRSRYSGGRGNYITLYSALDDRSYVYMHLQRPSLLQKGETVSAGQVIGRMGCTGTCSGTHLHFEVRNGKALLRAKTKAVDPLVLLKDWPQAPRS